MRCCRADITGRGGDASRGGLSMRMSLVSFKGDGGCKSGVADRAGLRQVLRTSDGGPRRSGLVAAPDRLRLPARRSHSMSPSGSAPASRSNRHTPSCPFLAAIHSGLPDSPIHCPWDWWSAETASSTFTTSSCPRQEAIHSGLPHFPQVRPTSSTSHFTSTNSWTSRAWPYHAANQSGEPSSYHAIDSTDIFHRTCGQMPKRTKIHASSKNPNLTAKKQDGLCFTFHGFPLLPGGAESLVHRRKQTNRANPFRFG
mmetsp:Transcript_97205/g.222710  ORF Transcript_97205/g.222710 Transcript_97205/m.222710 type:complete len:255 (+) Transcript_97205:496-1260(+)